MKSCRPGAQDQSTKVCGIHVGRELLSTEHFLCVRHRPDTKSTLFITPQPLVFCCEGLVFRPPILQMGKMRLRKLGPAAFPIAHPARSAAPLSSSQTQKSNNKKNEMVSGFQQLRDSVGQQRDQCFSHCNVHTNPLGSLLKCRFDSVAGKGVEFGACISNKLMCEAHAAGPGPHFEY